MSSGNPLSPPAATVTLSPTPTQGTSYVGGEVAINELQSPLEVKISDPDAWGAVSVAELNPLVAEAFTYGVGPRTYSSTAGSGTITTTNGLLSCATGTVALSYASLATRAVHYRPGQQTTYKFTAMFTAGVASSVQIAGPHTGGDGAGFGYNGTSFGILTRRAGKRAVAILTIATASSASATGTVRLNGTNFTTPTLSNAGGSQATTAAEIAAGTYAGWFAQQVGATVVFVAVAVGSAVAGSYTFTHATAAGTFPSNTVSADGTAVSESWVPQASWNIECMDGNGQTPTVLDPTKLNAYRILFRFLGSVGFIFEVYDPENTHWTPVHRQEWSNTNTQPVVYNPSFPMRWTSGSTGSTTNVTVSGGSCEVSVGGPLANTMPTWSVSAYNASVGTDLIPLVSIQVRRAFNNIATVAGLILTDLGAALTHTKSGYAYLYRGATLTGARFSAVDTDSIALVDTTATAMSGGKALFPLPLSGAGQDLVDVQAKLFRLEPGEVFTIGVAADSGSGADFRATMAWKELR